MTEKILQMLFLHWTKVDWIALSFVKHHRFKRPTKSDCEHSEHKIPIAKIEMPEALENIDKIVAYCDA
jgi:pyruvate kinase